MRSNIGIKNHYHYTAGIADKSIYMYIMYIIIHYVPFY